MPVFKPFKGIRPHQEYLYDFPTHPLSNYTNDEIKEKAEKENSYVKMVSPYLFGKIEDLHQSLSQVRANYEAAKGNQLVQDEKACYYLYRQTLPDQRVFRGLLGLVSVSDYKKGKIKKHEETLTHRKEKLAQYLIGVNLQAEPVLLTYPVNDELERMMDKEEQGIPVVDCNDSKGARYQIWKIENDETLGRYENILSQVEAFYIANGHHRMGSTALCAEEKAKENPQHTGEEAYNFIYGFIVSEKSIKINDFNKVVTDLNGLTTEEFLEKLREHFVVEEKGTEAYFPTQKQNMSMYLEGKFYNLKFKKECCSETCMDIIDHYLLEKYVLQPILGITDLKTSKRVDYQRGTSCKEGIERLKEKVDKEGYKVGFGAHPVSFEDLIEVADKNLKMPPKCTYIEPKLVTALVMYDMK